MRESKTKKITINLDKMSKGWFSHSERSFLWEIVVHNDKIYEIQAHDVTNLNLETRKAFNPDKTVH